MVIVVVSHIQRIGCQLEETYLHGGQSRNPTIAKGRGWAKNIPYWMRDVTKRAPPEDGTEYPVSGWTSMPQTKLIPAGFC